MACSGYFIGDSSLLIACCELFIDRGNNLLGVVSSSPEVHDWAEQQNLPYLADCREFNGLLSLQNCDYLISIASMRLMPGAILARTKCGGINFFDGLLPAQAGLNPPVWALLKGEKSHGVTWHRMASDSTSGEILLQEEFPIGSEDTVLNLNAKCFEAGIRTFDELIPFLSGDADCHPQPLKAFGLSNGTANLKRVDCAIDWNAPGEELVQLVRALDFGDYFNPVGSPTIVIDGQAYIVKELSKTDESSIAEPGTISTVLRDQLCVNSGSGIVAVKRITSLCGRPIAIDEFVNRHRLRIGSQLAKISNSARERLFGSNRYAKSEAFWRARLSQVKSTDVLQSDMSNLCLGVGQLTFHDFEIPQEFSRQFGTDLLATTIPAAFAAFLARASQASEISLAIEPSCLQSESAELLPWVSSRVPVSISVDLHRSFDVVRENWKEQCELIADRGSWLRDLVGRSPELRGRDELKDGRLDIVGIMCVDDITQITQADGLRETTSPQLVVARGKHNGKCRLCFDPSLLSPSAAEGFCDQFTSFLVRIALDPQKPLANISTLTSAEESQILVSWNKTAVSYPHEACIHELFESQVEQTPDAEAVAYGDQAVTYRELNERANRLARRLLSLGIAPDRLVGVCLDRSVDMVVAILAVQKSGGAYLPLDPTFPASRLEFMLKDSGAEVVITQRLHAALLPASVKSVIQVDEDWLQIKEYPVDNLRSMVRSEHLAYVIYTSGSTGIPKGVMLEHRNVVNFFVGMDECISHKTNDSRVWLAVTSLSFDISVLELLWTLTRGFKVVLYSERYRIPLAPDTNSEASPMRFSLFYFASSDRDGAADKYRLLMEGAKFADKYGFVAVSTPERHFHSFGGLFPNPAVTAAAIAAVTERVQIRAGSVVLPLHHPIRVAEEWSLVDNLSNGRAAISFASGWQPVDFVIRPDAYKNRHERLYEDIQTVRRLWRGEEVEFPGVDGHPQIIRTLPRPVQKEIPTWITSAGSPETWRRAGEIGANVLTHLLGQSIEEIREKALLYRKAYREAGHDGNGYVTLMLHTFVADNIDMVRETVRAPMREYLRSSIQLVKNVASLWSAYKRRLDGSVASSEVDLEQLSEDEMDGLLDFSFERYFQTSGLFGTPQSCLETVRRLREIGVDEIACLIDFGVETETALRHLDDLNRLRILAEQEGSAQYPTSDRARTEESIGALIQRHNVTHLQCTPSMASMILADKESSQSLRNLQWLLIGGEVFPPKLARELRAATGATILNMYGPTETTIWSSTHTTGADEDSIPIGRPIANTQFYVLDKHLQPVPVGRVGELYIGGDGVARGYHDRTDLSTKRFLKNPFSADTSARMYATGDLARFRLDGIVEFIGRKDHQVKIRGHRIELGEIEVKLCKHPEVVNAVVIVREDVAGDLRLVGYYTGKTNRSIAESELRDYVRTSLPEYMIPNRFVAIEKFPLTPNRKVDRNALPPPSVAVAPKAKPTESRLESGDDLEEEISLVWQELLGISHVGLDENFFDLGGHSLLAIQAHRRLKELCGKEISITDLFQYSTVRRLAAFLRQDSNDGQMGESRARGTSRREMMQRRNVRGPSTAVKKGGQPRE